MSTQLETLKENLLCNQNTWLVTGCAGFIGSNLLETLLKLNQKVIGLDNYATGSEQNIEDVLRGLDTRLKNNFTFYQADIRSLDECRKAIQGVDYVLHQAALGSVPRSIKTPELTNEVNVTGFLNVLLAAKDAAVKSFVYASSSSVYGDSPILPKVETHVGNPLSPYAVSKYTNELYAKAFSGCYGINIIGLRYFNVFGARQNPNGPYAAVIPVWISNLLKNQAIYINGDGETTRDFCYIENVIQANLLAATAVNPAAFGKVYNIAVGDQTSLNELLELIKKNLKIENLSVEVVYRGFRDGDVRHSLADISQAQTLLNYQPRHSIRDGLQLAMPWYIKHLK